MYLGEMVETCEIAALDAAPWHPYTEALLSSSHSVDPGSDTRRVRLQGSLPKRTEDLPGCPFASRCPCVRLNRATTSFATSPTPR
mgnify:CR=1 FL=1